jgi:hypothetical protein
MVRCVPTSVIYNTAACANADNRLVILVGFRSDIQYLHGSACATE